MGDVTTQDSTSRRVRQLAFGIKIVKDKDGAVVRDIFLNLPGSKT